MIRTLEKYSSGRRGAPAKGIGRVTGARVQIPPSPFSFAKNMKKKSWQWIQSIVSCKSCDELMTDIVYYDLLLVKKQCVSKR